MCGPAIPMRRAIRSGLVLVRALSWVENGWIKDDLGLHFLLEVADQVLMVMPGGLQAHQRREQEDLETLRRLAGVLL